MMLQEGEIYRAKNGDVVHNISNITESSVYGTISNHSRVPRDFRGTWNRDTGKCLGVKGDGCPTGLNLSEFDIDLRASDAFISDLSIPEGNYLDMGNLSGDFDGVAVAMEIAGRTISLPNGSNDTQALMRALEQAFEEIDALRERIETIERAPAIEADV